MSDGTWGSEYRKAGILEEKIKQYCKKNNIECPKFDEYARSWELKKIFEDIKSKTI